MITYVRGDLFAADECAIAHGCNCHGVMGAGVAYLVKQNHPDAFLEYQRAVIKGQFYPGVAQSVRCWTGDEVTTVYNLATQNAPGANAKLEYVRAAMRNMKRHMDYQGNRRIAMPKIGSGIGGLHWHFVEVEIEDVFKQTTFNGSYDVRVYEL